MCQVISVDSVPIYIEGSGFDSTEGGGFLFVIDMGPIRASIKKVDTGALPQRIKRQESEFCYLLVQPRFRLQ
jgi:hypothetical protein